MSSCTVFAVFTLHVAGSPQRTWHVMMRFSELTCPQRATVARLSFLAAAVFTMPNNATFGTHWET